MVSEWQNPFPLTRLRKYERPLFFSPSPPAARLFPSVRSEKAPLFFFKALPFFCLSGRTSLLFSHSSFSSLLSKREPRQIPPLDAGRYIAIPHDVFSDRQNFFFLLSPLQSGSPFSPGFTLAQKCSPFSESVKRLQFSWMPLSRWH